MSRSELTADELTLPIKRTAGETLADRMTANAYENILPARYLRKDADGNLVEDQEDLFVRVGRNIALAEAVYEADKRDMEVTVTPQQLKPGHPRREKLAEEVFGTGTRLDDDVEVALTERNVNKFAYETVVPQLPREIREHVEEVAATFIEGMESLSFIPNSPTLMNAGDELQQLSACFVMSPDDDLSDIHETAKKAAEVFQCLTADTQVITQTGVTSIDSVEPGDEILQRDETGYRMQEVTQTHAYDDAPVQTVVTESGISVTGTPNHKLEINDEWRELDDASAGDHLSLRLDWLASRARPVELESVEAGPQWHTRRTVSNETIAALHATGMNDYEIARELDSSPSTIQRRRADELGLPPNGSGGRPKGSTSFEIDALVELHTDGLSDREIAAELGISKPTVRRVRTAQQLERNGKAVKEVTQPEVLSSELAELVGMWIGDGSVHADGIRFHVNREELLEHIDHRARELFDIGVDWSWAEGCYEVAITSHEIKRWWLDNFGEGKPSASEASVPAPVLESGRAEIGAFLRGLFSTDGSLQKDKYPRLWSASETLIEEVQHLLLGLGIPAMRWELDSDERDYFNVGAVSETGLKTYIEAIGFIDERHERMAETIESSGFRPISSGELIGETEWRQPIERIESAGTETVYDVTVEGEHEYLANSIVSHNSGGGVGYGFWNLRPFGDSVGSTGGIASGPITFMRTYDQLCETIAQGGTRRGAQMGIMRVSHPDVIEFIHAKNKDVSLAHSLRLNDPDDYTYTSFSEALEEARSLIDEEGRVPKHLRNAVEGHLSNFNISVGVTDTFMEALKNDGEYTFTNPRTDEPHIATAETKEMYSRYDLGEYVTVGEELSVPASVIWDRIVQGAHENGEPGVIYLERVNKEHSFDVEEQPDHRILATNPCLTGEMEVQLADGTSAPIASLVEDQIEVKTLEDDGLTTKPATAFCTKRDATVIRVEFDSGQSLRATPDHEVRTADGTWVEAGDLTPGDSVRAVSAVRATPQGSVQETTIETVSTVEPDGQADVFDLHVDETHNFFASASGRGGINVHNCGEQPLEEFEACNLGHINLSTLAAMDAPDWRVWSERNAHAYDSHEDAVAAFLEEAIDWAAFDERIEYGTRFLENVVTMSDFPVEEITETVRRMRKIGLGIMGLAQLYVQLGIKYGSEEGNEVARQLMTHINHGAKATSHELATERGSFADWNESKYADPVRYREWFEHQTGESADEWADGFPIRNHNVTTIAPTGTTSMVGNTTGGCEPIYNVAYYKNVTDDVQGEEMLVEFDDYFLRTLEANNIDVDAVKAEAQEQMAANEFDGVEGLSTVPDAIGELFVITGDLSAQQHAAVQCACQAGVDSAISKTVNAPNESTLEDAKAVFEWVYENGGKGVTYYRDGTRSKQVLTTRADNADFADESEAVEVIHEQIEEVFGDLESFIQSDELHEVAAAEVEALLEDLEPEYAEKRVRPDALQGVSQRIDTGYGKVYVTINEDPESNRPFELFANIGHSGGFTNSFTEALAKVISTALRSGVDPYEIVDELCGTRSPKVAWDKGEQIQSIPDAIGTAMRRYLDDEIDKPYPTQATLEESAEAEADRAPVRTAGPNADTPDTDEPDDVTQDLIDAGESPECPECGSLALYFAEGCKTCESCGWSEC